jgi:hypothetical protein
MAYIPPIKKRDYINPLSKTMGGKIIAHTCSKCRVELPVKTKGVWFELVNTPDRWAWVCGTCLDKRGIRY